MKKKKKKTRDITAELAAARKAKVARRAAEWRKKKIQDLFLALALDWLALRIVPTRMVSELLVGGLAGCALGFLPFYFARKKHWKRVSFWFMAVCIITGGALGIPAASALAAALFAVALYIKKPAPAQA